MYLVSGGSGKSTLARMLYNDMLGGFDATAFVDLGLHSVNDPGQLGASSNQGTVDSVLSMLRQFQAETTAGMWQQLPFMDRAGLRRVVSEVAEHSKLLLVLDDVCTEDQLDYLLPNMLVPGSRLVFTSRVPGFPGSSVFQVSATTIVQVTLRHALCGTSRQRLSTRPRGPLSLLPPSPVASLHGAWIVRA